MPYIASTSDFTAEEIQILENADLLLPSRTASGMRNFHTAIFGPPSTKTSNASSTTTASVKAIGFNSSTSRYIELPLSEHSAEALEFVGFTPPIAGRIFNNWIARPNPNQNPDGLIDYGIGWVRRLQNFTSQGISPDEAMQRVGLNDSLRAVILNPRFQRIFKTESLFYWIKDTLQMKYGSIYRLQQRLKQHAARSLARKNSDQHSPSQQTPEISSIAMTPEDFLLPTAHIALDCESPVLPNHIALYKGMATERLFPNPLVLEDGSVDLSSTCSRECGDFHWTNSASYWNTNKEVADEYRQWAAARSPTSETQLIRIQVPKTWVRSLGQKELLYGDEWRQFVWHSRRNRTPPTTGRELWRPAQVHIIKGHICTGFSREVAPTSENVMRVAPGNNRKAMQWAFVHVDAITELARQVRGKIHIDIFAAQEPGFEGIQ